MVLKEPTFVSVILDDLLSATGHHLGDFQVTCTIRGHNVKAWDGRRWGMADADGLILQVLPAADSDAEELADLAAGLHDELLSVDGASVAPLPAEAAPEGAKGLGDVAGWLAAQFGTLDGLRTLVAAVRGFAARTGRTVEVSMDGDHLKVTGATSQQQEEIIDAWLARHAPGV